jgi:hypothetical protein
MPSIFPSEDSIKLESRRIIEDAIKKELMQSILRFEYIHMTANEIEDRGLREKLQLVATYGIQDLESLIDTKIRLARLKNK